MKQESSFIMKPKVDFCFKKLMESETVRQGFIAAVLGILPEAVIETKLLPTHLRKEYAEDKQGILDVRVLLNGNIQIDMEIQVAQFPLWPERSLFYLSKMYMEQIKSGEDYKVLKKCIHVGMLDFVLFKNEREFYSRFHLWEDNRRLMYSDKFEIHIVELPKAVEGGHTETALLEWAKFIHAETKEELEMAAKTDPYIGIAYDELLCMSADEEKRREYDARLKAILDHNYLMSINWEDGFSQGEARGEQRGIFIGEEKKLIELISKKIKKGCSVEKIADMLEEEESVVQEIYDTAIEFGPEYDADKIMQKIKEKRKQMQISVV